MSQRKKANSGGALICIEGIDGAGKTTQARLLCQALERDGYETVYLKEPTDGPYGRRIRALANEGRHEITPMEEFRLFLEDRRQDVGENIRPALESGKIVVIDRYYYSSIAYQGALGLDMGFINEENRKIAICPDIVVYLSIPSSISPQRIEKSRGDSINLFEKVDYLERVKANFDSMIYPEIWKVDGNAPVDDIHEKIYQRVKEILSLKSPESD